MCYYFEGNSKIQYLGLCSRDCG